MKSRPFDVNAMFWCFKHNRFCRRYTAASAGGLLLEIAGSPCVGFSYIGAMLGFLDTSCLAFLAWIDIMRSVSPHIMIHECTEAFPHQVLDMLLNEGFDVRYIIESIVTCMTDVCVPIKRKRRYTVCRLQSLRVSGAFTKWSFERVVAWELKAYGEVFFCMLVKRQ